MKKITTVVLTFVFCLGLASTAKAVQHSKRKSLDLRVVSGHYNSTTVMGGAAKTKDRDSVTGLDLNLLFHKRFMGLSWGPILRQRSISDPTGKLNFVGVGGSVGYLSNTFEDKNRWPIGWHVNLGVAIGSLSGMRSTYQKSPVSAMSSLDVGLDMKLRGWDSPEPGKYKSALVASLGYGVEAIGVTLTSKTNPPARGSMSLSGAVPKFGLSYYW